MRVWQLMQAIPKGTVLTYGDAATALNSAARAVGGACKANPIPLIIPCHRIVAKQSIGGFSGKTKGETIDLKMFLLQHEGVLSAKFTGI
nr:MGMT family protein [Echinimonas agarilytica]